MALQEYFKITKGTGILSTADDKGQLEVTVYPLRPHLLDDETMLLVMENNVALQNLKANPRAVFTFLVAGNRLEGKKLIIDMTDLKKEVGVGFSMRGKKLQSRETLERFLVYFKIEQELPLVEFKV